MATHSGILAWRIPWTEEPGGQQSIGSQRIGHEAMTKRMFLDFWMVILVTPWICRKPSLDIAWKHNGLRPGHGPQSSQSGWGRGASPGETPGTQGFPPPTLCGASQVAPHVSK